jgi:hypothetical protein
MKNIIKVSLLSNDNLQFNQYFVTDKGIVEAKVGNETFYIRIDEITESEVLDRLVGNGNYE